MHRYGPFLSLLFVAACSSPADSPSPSTTPKDSVGRSVPVVTDSRWVPESDSSFAGGLRTTWGLTSYRGDERAQHFTISFKPHEEPPGWLKVLDVLSGHGKSDEIRTAHQAELDFRPWTVASAGIDRFAVAGRGADSAFVVESWTLRDTDAISLRDAPRDPSDLGPAVARQFHKERIYRTEEADSIGPLLFDSRARSVLLVLWSGEQARLVRLANLPNAAPQLVLDSAQCPELLAIENGYAFYQEGVGICYSFTPGFKQADEGAPGLHFIDHDDDGEFDAPPIIATQEALEAQGIGAFMDTRDAYDR